MNRNRLITGGAVFVFLILMIPASIILRREWQNGQTQVNWREPLPSLGYCSSEQVTPCIVSFSLDAGGKMLVSILTDGPSFPNFYLKIKHSKGENIYPCQEVQGFSTSVYCTGIALPLGEIFQFFILSVNDNRVLAQGNFSIIGLALAAIDIYTSPTLGTPSTAMTVSATETFLPGTPAPPTSTRTPSYPNPPTPTLSYPNPKP